MTIIPLPAFEDNYIWILVGDNEKSAVCVDPGEATQVISFLQKNNLKLEAILLTHHHHDHTGGVVELADSYPEVTIYGPKDARMPMVNRLLPLDATDYVKLFNFNFAVLATPGHTATHLCYYEKNYKLLFCGDTLFSAGCGRVFDSSIDLLHDSLLKLKKLPDATRVYCAHEYTRQNLRFALHVEPDNRAINDYYQTLKNNSLCSLPSTIGLEKLINPFFRTGSKQVKNYATNAITKTMSCLEIFTKLRQDKNNF